MTRDRTDRTAAEVMAAECLCFRARRVSRALTRLYDEALRPLGLQATQLTLLNAIAMGGEDGMAMSRLADILAMDLATLSRNLRPLVRASWVHLARSPADRRVRVASLTTDGRQMVADAFPRWQEAHRRASAVLGGAEPASELRDRLDAVAHAIAAAQRRAYETAEEAGRPW